MQIFIMRHGKAEHFAPSDAQRALTEKGKKESTLVATWLAEQVKSIDLVLVSPYVRAQETWQSCETILPNAKKVLIEAGITPYGDSKQVASYINALISTENLTSVLIISHLPLVNYLATEFAPATTSLSFSTSAICQIEFDSKTQVGEIINLKTPEDICY